MMGIYPSSLPSLLRTPSLNLLPPTLLQLVLPDTDTPATSEDPYSAYLPQCFVPISIYDRVGGSASVCSGVTIKPIHVIIACHHDVASIGGVPINEFTTEGYFSCAFPTLFPTGAGDFSGQRQNQVTIGNYFKHLTMYDDNRFAKHPRFRFFALNTEMRWRALQTSRVYVKQHPGDAQLSLDELRDMVGREGQTFSNRVHGIREYQNSYLLFTKVSMYLGISHSLCSVVHNYDSLCRRSSRSPIMLSILLVHNWGERERGPLLWTQRTRCHDRYIYRRAYVHRYCACAALRANVAGQIWNRFSPAESAFSARSQTS